MKPLEAYAVLEQATDPRTVGKLTRGDYVMIHEAFQALSDALTRLQQLENDRCKANGSGSVNCDPPAKDNT